MDLFMEVALSFRPDYSCVSLTLRQHYCTTCLSRMQFRTAVVFARKCILNVVLKSLVSWLPVLPRSFGKNAAHAVTSTVVEAIRCRSRCRQGQNAVPLLPNFSTLITQLLPAHTFRWRDKRKSRSNGAAALTDPKIVWPGRTCVLNNQSYSH